MNYFYHTKRFIMVKKLFFLKTSQYTTKLKNNELPRSKLRGIYSY